ncbi:MAG TPA: tetratricopeptide repeat protein [Thermoguttaceae bacterium]|nr:tetratricopeptide repeat protein [Thermoguttaceae bacterium]
MARRQAKKAGKRPTAETNRPTTQSPSPPHRPRPPRRRLPAKLLLLAGSIAVALLMGELAIRLIGQAPEIIPIGVSSDKHVYRRSTNPILSYEFKPGFRSDEENLAFDYRVINSHGLRDVERQYEKPPGTKRVILLGDSVVVGYRIREIDQLMSRQLEMFYRDENVEVLNVAVTGYCTRAEIELLRVQGSKYDPDAVILVFVENDFRNFNPESVGADGIANRPGTVDWLFRRSHLFRLACVRLNWFAFGLETDPASWNQRAIGDNNVVEGLALFRELADRHGFKPLVVAWPGFAQDGIEYPEKMFMPGSKELIIERLARMHGLPVVGLREAFREHWLLQVPRPIPREYYTVGDEMHASVDGHRVTAEILRCTIEEHRLLEPAKRQVARALPASGEDDAAIRAARSLGTEKADYGLFYINQAVTLYEEGKLDEAIEQLEKVSPSDSLNYADARVMLASILAQQGKTEDAKSRLQEVIEAEPDHFQARMVLAGLLTAEQAYPQAESHLGAAVRLHPDDVMASNALASVLVGQGRTQEAIRQFRRSLQIDPGDKTARTNIEFLQSRSLP